MATWTDLGVLTPTTNLPALLGIAQPEPQAQGLLSEGFDNPLLALGAGLLAASGPSTTPVSFGQALASGLQAASQAQRQALLNQVARAQLTETARKQQAAEKLQGLLSGGLDSTSTPQLLGLLAQTDPERFSAALLGRLLPQPLSPLEQATLAKVNVELGQQQAANAAQRSALEDTAISAAAALNALDTIEKIPGADALVINPGLVHLTRQALNAPDPTGLLAKLPSAISGIPLAQLPVALNAAETVNKQRNALGFSLSGLSQTGVAGLRARLESLGEGAGPEVQRSVFQQALDRAKREAEKTGQPLDLGELTSDLPKYDLPNRTAGGMIPPAAVAYLKAHSDDQSVLEQFRAKYGVDPSAFLR
jgi:hypothetical protein